jgi:large subunit ribosomal protein L11
MSELIKMELKIEKGSMKPGRETAATLTRQQVIEIGKKKMDDLNTKDEDMAARVVMGTARSMGIKIAE